MNRRGAVRGRGSGSRRSSPRSERRRCRGAQPRAAPRTGGGPSTRAAPGRPLWPREFDPLSLELVEGGLLYTRFVQLGNDAAEVRVVREGDARIATLTEAAGSHPLLGGVRRTVVALPPSAPAPQVADDGAAVTVRAPQLTARFENAGAERRGREVMVRLR